MRITTKYDPTLKIIYVRYFQGVRFPCFKAIKDEYAYNDNRLNKIVLQVLKAGYNVMVIRNLEILTIWIDDRNFRQR